MRLRQIEVFHAIYSTGSMTAAAAQLNVSQPSVSKVLAHAENQLGYRLFDRVKGKLYPTPEAHQLFAHVRTVYRDMDRLRHVAANLGTARAGRIRIAGTPAFGQKVLPDAIASFLAQYPDTAIEVETLHLDAIGDALRESRIDLGLAFNPSTGPGIGCEVLGGGRFVVLARDQDDFGGRQELAVRDLAGLPFIALNSRGPLGQALSDYIATQEVDLDIVAWCETYHLARTLVEHGVGVTIADEITARSGPAGGVRQFALAPALEFEVGVLHLDSMPLSVAAGRLAEHIGAAVGELLSSKPAS